MWAYLGGAASIRLVDEFDLLSSLFVLPVNLKNRDAEILERLSFDLDVSRSPSVFCPRPPLHLPQPSLQDLHLLLEASGLIRRAGTSPSPDVQQDADTQQDSQPDGHHLRAHAVVAQDEHKTGQSDSDFQKPQGAHQSGGNQSEGKRNQPVADESCEDPLKDEDQALWGHFVGRKADCGKSTRNYISYKTAHFHCGAITGL